MVINTDKKFTSKQDCSAPSHALDHEIGILRKLFILWSRTPSQVNLLGLFVQNRRDQNTNKINIGVSN